MESITYRLTGTPGSLACEKSMHMEHPMGGLPQWVPRQGGVAVRLAGRFDSFLDWMVAPVVVARR